MPLSNPGYPWSLLGVAFDVLPMGYIFALRSDMPRHRTSETRYDLGEAIGAGAYRGDCSSAARNVWSVAPAGGPAL